MKVECVDLYLFLIILLTIFLQIRQQKYGSAVFSFTQLCVSHPVDDVLAL